MSKQRLDTLLVELNLCNSRQRAQRLIRAGEVKVNQQLVDKPGTQVPTDAKVTVKERPPYVSRGGEKLVQALQTFPIQVKDRVALDGGISTGGFTDCLLQNGAQQVYGVDVGYGQVAWKLRTDPRVILKERTNIRYLKPNDLYAPDAQVPDLGVMDVSFISLTKVLPAFWALLRPPREVVLLVKPQFEVGQERIGKKGVVRDPVAQGDAIATVLTAAETLGWQYAGLTWSPCPGPAGNIEFLLWMQMQQQADRPEATDLIQLAKTAQQQLFKAS
ncbi:16S/23S rRNA (cytidine-2'-O)-methyltransferase TlyA [Acaryochloris thomasi RCC1774]|uniref:16S/23S rRNA (Cytidine-2'-O)-methyltransferase TlyA n=1 Tax=Acaryochloris thomasi RCC1774 TaxID=1764569 RepID=A0A2W1JGZ2_9CYAN|nr:TlyA family RNA methyltransferase [Acaryochloris thomasi]PZD72798.1 16S/23S rRNA (cytidine-2'-O)-methyltransferase TlyA [Acaryochloris thomasi RCC1774]